MASMMNDDPRGFEAANFLTKEMKEVVKMAKQGDSKIVGFLLTGYRSDSNAGHAVAVIVTDDNELEVFNWGQRGRLSKLAHFFTIYPRRIDIAAYKLKGKSVARKLDFGSMSKPPNRSPSDCPPATHFLRTSKTGKKSCIKKKTSKRLRAATPTHTLSLLD